MSRAVIRLPAHTVERAPPTPLGNREVLMAVRVDVHEDKVSIPTRTERASKVGEVAPSGALYLANATVKAALDTLVADGASLAAAEAQVVKDEAQVTKSRGTRDALLVTFDGSYDIGVATLEKYATKPADITDSGLVVLERTKYPVVVPAGLTAKYDPVKLLLDIHVTHGLGMRSAQVRTSTDPIGATTWTLQDGIAAEYHLPNFAPGTYWVEARSVRGTEVSAWIGPVSVVVK
jgi:hypothetical protein